MIMKIKKSLWVLMSAAMVSLCLSCEDTMLNNMVDDRVYLLKEGVNEVNVFNVGRPTIPVKVIKSGVGQRAVQLRMEIDPDFLTEYNQANGTSYGLLDPATYQMGNATIEMEASAYEASFEIFLDSEAYISELLDHPDITFAIPCRVTIENSQGNDSQEMRTLVIPKLVEPFIQFEQAGVLTDIYTITPTSSPTLWYYLKVVLNYPNDQQVDFSVRPATNQEALIQTYNQEHGTTYVVFPESAYELEENSVIPEGTDQAAFRFHVSKDKLVNDQVPYGQYMLALEIDYVSLNNIHPSNNIVIIPFAYHE